MERTESMQRSVPENSVFRSVPDFSKDLSRILVYTSPKSGYLHVTNPCGYCYNEIHCMKPYNINFMAGFGHYTPACHSITPSN